MVSTSEKSVIRYYPDYKIADDAKKNVYQLSRHGVKRSVDVYTSDGASIEHLLVETFDRLDEVRAGADTVWPSVYRFAELRANLVEDAQECYDTLVARDYPTDADKTDANYENLQESMTTMLGSQSFPGDKVLYYLTHSIKYLNCKDKNGKIDKPTNVLNRMQRIKRMGARLRHNQGATFINDTAFKAAFWDIFPDKMKQWLIDEQDKDPYDATNPFDVEDIADNFQRYWNIHYAKEASKDGGTKRKRDGDDDGGGSNSNGGGRTNKHHKGGRGRGRGGGRGGGRGNNAGERRDCLISTHKHHKHDWRGCFLNPKSFNFDAVAAEDFYNNHAKGDDVFYREMYTAGQQNSSRGHGGGGGRGWQSGRGGGGRGYGGRGGGGRGGGGRGGYQGGRGQGRGNGGRGGGYNNNNNYQQNGGGEGYHYQQNEQQSYQNDQGGERQQQPQQQPTQQQQQQQQSYHFQGAPRAPPGRGNQFGGRGNQFRRVQWRE